MVKLGSTVVLALLACAQARSMLRATSGGELLASNLDLSVLSSSEDNRAVILDGTPLLEFAKKAADDEEADAGADGEEAPKKKKKKKAKKADEEEAGAGEEEDAAPAKKKKGKKAKKADDAEDADAVAGGEDEAPKKKKKGKKGKKGDDADAPEVDAGGDEEDAPKKKKGKKGKKGKKADDEEGADATEDAVDADVDALTAANATANATAVIDPATGLPVTTPLPDAALNGTAPADATDAAAAGSDATATPADATAAANATAPAEPVNTTVTVNDDGSLDAVTSVPAAPARPVEDEFPTSPDCHPEALPEAKIMNDDKVCKAELPKFYDATTGLNFDDRKDADKVKLMDKFCKSTCGNKYTQYVLAARKLDLTCAPSIQQLLVQASDKAQAGRDEAINHQGEDTGKKALEPPKNSIVGKKKEDKPKKEEAKKDNKKAKKTADDVDDLEEEHLFGNEDKKKVDDVTYFGGITRAMGAGTYKPTGHYPGLTLGCLKADDGKYCATKKAAMNDKHDGCQFYKSCCFGEYLAGLQNTEKVITVIEKKCPGSKAFATKLCKH